MGYRRDAFRRGLAWMLRIVGGADREGGADKRSSRPWKRARDRCVDLLSGRCPAGQAGRQSCEVARLDDARKQGCPRRGTNLTRSSKLFRLRQKIFAKT